MYDELEEAGGPSMQESEDLHAMSMQRASQAKSSSSSGSRGAAEGQAMLEDISPPPPQPRPFADTSTTRRAPDSTGSTEVKRIGPQAALGQGEDVDAAIKELLKIGEMLH